MGFPSDPDTGAMWAVLLVALGLPALLYAGIARFTGHGRKGGAVWRPLNDRLYLVCALLAVVGHAGGSVVVGSWGDLFGFMPTAFMGGCFSSALAYTCVGDQEGRALRPELLPLAPYALALGFFGRIAG
ncbi:hypothetical protein R6V09_32760 [Streptomyces sp. W16]|uniref:hypothetical protein n=1 Tax=Streptomyces sp. W16 TaxID=3076631 RepID=UPI00295AE81A|nr:hypothetical protein [Streptomyces sp. W16]MDV9174871.1 hypothetical protein [Streptomyces sp. W16]